MANDRDSQAAWIAVPSPGDLPTEVADEIADVSSRIGFVPNVARLLAVTPHAFHRLVEVLRRSDAGVIGSQ
jgi:hypothetical protein